MKNLFIITLLIVFIIGCGKSEEKTKLSENDDQVTAVIKEKGPVFKLKYKFNKGDKFSYKLQTITNSIEEISADTTIMNDISQSATYNMNFVVKNVDKNNTTELEVRINSITAETNYNGQTSKYDSKFIYSTRERTQFVDYEAVKKVPFRIAVNEIGQVVKVDKIDKIMRNMLAIQNVPDTLSAKTKEQLKFNISNGTLMPLTQQIFKVVSENEVGVDSSWQLKYTAPLAIFNVENTAIFKISEITIDKDTTASIASSLVISVSGNNVVSEKGVTYTFAQPLLEASGSVKYNNSKGLVELSESTTKLEMSMIIDGVDNKNNPIRSTKKDISNSTNVVELL
jgi:Family of unknown function (DUF6263)